MNNNKAFSLIEVQVSLVIASILILTIGIISSISNDRYIKLRREADVYGDISYGLKLIQYKVRKANSMPTIIAKSNTEWVNGNQLVVDNAAFGLYQPANSNNVDLVYLEDKSDESDREVILTVPNAEPLNLSLSSDNTSIIVQIDGSKNGVAFDLSSRVMRRVE